MTKRFHIFLVKPSKYDDDGYVIQHWRGVLPSNTLACLNGLTEDVREKKLLGDIDVRVYMIDESVMKVPLKKIVRLSRRRNEKILVALVGVQTNQFCRASDLALVLRKENIPVMIGGFHVSGVISIFGKPTPEVQQLIDAGVSVVAGEVEEHWTNLLRDALEDRLQPVYNFLDQLPDLSSAPLPRTNRRYLRHFVFDAYGTVDTSRGCPFKCSFCTIINVQGRKNRYRSPEWVEKALRKNYQENGISFYFFTDDNFARNPAWEEIFDRLIRLREEEGIPIEFMIQVDVVSYKIPGFIEKAAGAGCTNVFIGMESLNPKNLLDASKTQNHVDKYRDLIDAWHRAGVSTHVGYIIGFPHDTVESVRQDLQRLMKEVRPQRASFFMLTPLPGSMDHKGAYEKGTPMDADYNNFDSFHQVVRHPHLVEGQWPALYMEAWRTFYSPENMKAVLKEAPPETYWNVFRNFLWYKNAALNEGLHPMIAGFFRLKGRKMRRPGYPVEGFFRYWRWRLPEIYRYLRDAVRLLLEMEEIWLQTRRPTQAELRLIAELDRAREGLRSHANWEQLAEVYSAGRSYVLNLATRSKVRQLWDKLTLRETVLLRQTRQDLTQYWSDLVARLRQGQLWVLVRVDRLTLNFLHELHLMSTFLKALTSEQLREGSGA